MHFVPRFLLGLMLLPAAGCHVSESLENAAKKITLNTPEPIKVEMKVAIDVYEHDGAVKEKEIGKDNADGDIAEVNRRKFNREKEIQDLKNSRLVAETHRGILFLREQPAGTYGEYVKKTVSDENTDRQILMRDNAAKQRRELNEIMREHYDESVKNAFAGEWIEVPDPAKPDAYKLVQKVKTE